MRKSENTDDDTTDVPDLMNQVKEVKKNIVMLKIRKSYDDFKDVSQIRKSKKEFARIMTTMNNLKYTK